LSNVIRGTHWSLLLFSGRNSRHEHAQSLASVATQVSARFGAALKHT
jgi:hypothetical protein